MELSACSHKQRTFNLESQRTTNHEKIKEILASLVPLVLPVKHKQLLKHIAEII
jgi:hypothetical protein